MLKRVQREAGKSEGECLRLKLDVRTRWGSTRNMLQRFIEISDVIIQVALHFQEVVMLSGAELMQLKTIILILDPIDEATKEMSSAKYTTTSKVIPTVQNIIDVSFTTYSFSLNVMDKFVQLNFLLCPHRSSPKCL